MEPGYLSQYSD